MVVLVVLGLVRNSRMTKTIKDSIAKSVKKLSKTASKKLKAEPADWYAKAKASIGISKTDEPQSPRSR